VVIDPVGGCKGIKNENKIAYEERNGNPVYSICKSIE